MLCSEQQITWSENILSSYQESGISPSSVAVWLRGNLGKLNLAINGSYYLSGDCILPEFSTNISGIYESIFECDYLRKKSVSLINTGGGLDWSELNGDGQGTIRRVSKNEQIKTLRTMSQDCQERLNQLIEWYNGGDAGAGVTQVLTDFRGDISTYVLNNFPSCDYYSEYNTVWN